MIEPATVHVLTLGCARNDVDSEEVAARLEAAGFALVAEPGDAQTVVVNTCGFIEAAKKDSVDALLAAADLKGNGVTQRVIAIGCMAERYGQDLAEALPEADAILGFDDYGDIATRVRSILAGERPTAHVPQDRRLILPLAPASRPLARASSAGNAPASGPRVLRRRLDGGPSAPLKIASGCDRRCSFCAIPTFRGAFLSRPMDEIVAEAQWLAEQGVREVVLVSENSSSYGKDLQDPRALERLLALLSAVDGLEWIRVSYLQPAEVRPSLLDAMTSVHKVVPYFDLSFQHASASVLRRMRRFGDPTSFLTLLDDIRHRAPLAGIRTNVIVGFPGETAEDFAILRDWVSAARLDAVGVFAYSDEEGSEAATLDGHLPESAVSERLEAMTDLAAELTSQRAEERIGERVHVLLETVEDGRWVGRAQHQGPEVDSVTYLAHAPSDARIGDLIWGRVAETEGVDLVAVPESHDGFH